MSDLTPPAEHSADPVSSDIRLLGRLLGDAIRATEGDETFDLVEHVRLLAVDGRRTGTSSVAAIRDALSRRPLAEQLLVLRALDWLSLLANTGEDVHVERRRRHERRGTGSPRPGSLRAAIDRILVAGVPPEQLLATGTEIRVTPVITAHPTEVRRKTILEVLEEQARAGMTVMVVTHNREISRVADRVIELSSGRIVGDGPPAGGKAEIGDLQW